MSCLLSTMSMGSTRRTLPLVPKLWKDTVAEHRRDVRVAIHEAAWSLASECGVRGVTMGAVAERAGIARATLYKYFSGVEEVLVAAHEDRVTKHLLHLQTARSSAKSAGEGVRRLLAGYAQICFHRGQVGTPDLRSFLRSGEQHEQSESQLHALFAESMAAAQREGQVRSDLPAGELAAFCVNALAAAGILPSRTALDRLVSLVWESLHPAKATTSL